MSINTEAAELYAAFQNAQWRTVEYSVQTEPREFRPSITLWFDKPEAIERLLELMRANGFKLQ